MRNLRPLALALCWAFWASCSYSEPFTYGQTGNAAVGGLTWDMSVLPKESGLTVNGVIYQYTAVKRPEDAMLVHVQNLDARGNGYVFRETDDWSGRPGTTINKMVSVDNVPIGNWGKGSIEVDGQGTVEKPNVVYTYKIDHCFNPQSSPSCPGYKPVIPETPAVYSALDDSSVKSAMSKTEQEYKQQEAKKEKIEKIKDSDKSVESIAQSMILQSMNVTNLSSYYALKIDGGVYKDTVKLVDAKLPENRIGLRNGLAQQILHERMVDSQYQR